MELLGRLRPVEVQLPRVDLGRVGRLAVLRLGDAEALGEPAAQHLGADGREPVPQFVGRLLRSDGDGAAVVDIAGVQTFVDGHDADAGIDVAGQDGPLHRGRAPPAGQQREVDVHHRHLLEHVRLDELAEGDDHAELDWRLEGEDVVDLVGNGDAGGRGRGADRTGQQRSPAAPLLLRLGDGEGDVMAVADQRFQGDDRRLRRSEESQPHPSDRRL